MLRRRQAVFALAAMSCFAQPDPCAKFGLTPIAGGNGYGWRANRCEGVFAQSVSGALDIHLISFASGLSGVNPQNAEALRLTWAAPQTLPVQLGAISLRNRHYYRMDATLPAAATSFVWPTDALRRERLSGAELGVVAWTSLPAIKDIYLPLSVDGAAAPPELKLRPGTELRDLNYSVQQLGPDGKPGRKVVSEKELGLGYYPAGRGVPVSLPARVEGGLYRLDVTATAKSGGSLANEFVVYLPKSQ